MLRPGQSNEPIKDVELPPGFNRGTVLNGILFSSDWTQCAVREENGRVEVSPTPDDGRITIGENHVDIAVHRGDVRHVDMGAGQAGIRVIQGNVESIDM